MERVESKKRDLKVIEGGDCSIYCDTGALWITYINSEDIVLRAKESIKLTGKEGIVIQSLLDSKYRVETTRAHNALAV